MVFPKKIIKSGCVRDSIRHFCWSVCQLGGLSVTEDSEQATYENYPLLFFLFFLPSETLLKIFSKIIIKHSRMDIFITKHKI